MYSSRIASGHRNNPLKANKDLGKGAAAQKPHAIAPKRGPAALLGPQCSLRGRDLQLQEWYMRWCKRSSRVGGPRIPPFGPFLPKFGIVSRKAPTASKKTKKL